MNGKKAKAIRREAHWWRMMQHHPAEIEPAVIKLVKDLRKGKDWAQCIYHFKNRLDKINVSK